MKHLFIAGCARSGTTALTRLLNADERIIVGTERYIKVCREITPEHFEKERFLNRLPREARSIAPEAVEKIRAKWDTGLVEYVGDKVPRYYLHMDRLVAEFPQCKILFLWRDLHSVASSYNVRLQRGTHWPKNRDYRRAVMNWNRSLDCLRNFVNNGFGDQVHVVKFESFFSGDMPYLESLYEFLNLDLRESDRQAYLKETKDWPKIAAKPLMLNREMIAYVEEHKNKRLETWLSRCLNKYKSLRPLEKKGR